MCAAVVPAANRGPGVDGTPSDADDQTTAYAYDSAGRLLTETAVMPSGSASQTTQYVYGVSPADGSAIASNDLLRTIEYPDPATGAASTAAAGQESYTYDALGNVLTKTDRNGTVHAYTYDDADRPVSDRVTTFGAGVDGAVRRIDTHYDARGNADQITSYGDTAGTTASIVNQVKRTYNDEGQITAEYQAVDGGVVSGTPGVAYAYAGLAEGNRLVSMTYPDGRTLTYHYGTAGSADDTIGRLTGISDSSGTLESYEYLGLSTVVERDHPQTGVNLTYINASAPAGSDPYTGLDQFGRVIDQKWVNVSGVAVDEYAYAYDADGNVITKTNVVNPADSELYQYDGLNRLTDMQRGTLTYINSVIIFGPSREQYWALDALGNSTSVTTDGTAVSRTNDNQNRLTGVGTAALAYDNDGNTTTDEQNRTLVYDAWNRLVEAKSDSTSLVRYAYDGLGRRTKEGATSIYYDAAWQRIEERDSAGNTTAQYTWSPVYIDAMIERDRDSDGDAGHTLDERLYPTQDANWNVTALVGTSGTAAGTIVQRYLTDAYGSRVVLTPSWAGSTEAYGFQQGFHGGVYDSLLTNLMLFRNRTLDTATMRWTQEDPQGTIYQDGFNLYGYVRSRPNFYVDYTGRAAVVVLAGTGSVGTTAAEGGGILSTLTEIGTGMVEVAGAIGTATAAATGAVVVAVAAPVGAEIYNHIAEQGRPAPTQQEIEDWAREHPSRPANPPISQSTPDVPAKPETVDYLNPEKTKMAPTGGGNDKPPLPPPLGPSDYLGKLSPLIAFGVLGNLFHFATGISPGTVFDMGLAALKSASNWVQTKCKAAASISGQGL